MTQIEILLFRFVDNFKAGHCLGVDRYIEQCPLYERLELEELLVSFIN